MLLTEGKLNRSTKKRTDYNSWLEDEQGWVPRGSLVIEKLKEE